MTTTIIIIFCSLLLVAYIFNITSTKTKIPSVILLLLMGWGLKQASLFFGLELPNLQKILPVLATMGLVLIVLEGALELKLNKSKLGLIGKSFTGALLSMLAMSFLVAFLFQHLGGFSFRDALINATPLCIISSAIAIPSASGLSLFNREFVIYESSLSDILGVLFFNFIVANKVADAEAFSTFGMQLGIMIGVALVATVALSILLKKVEHHVKFVPIILLVILIYAVAKVYHLPALIFILIFGLSIGNIQGLKRIKWIKNYDMHDLEEEIEKFKDLTIEGAFLIRALFFILFGFLLETSEILNTDTILWSILIVTIIYTLRIIQLKFSSIDLTPLLFVAPRGLITILLFLAIDPENSIAIVNNSLIIQVILLTALVMTFGLMFGMKKEVQPVIVGEENQLVPVEVEEGIEESDAPETEDSEEHPEQPNPLP